MEEASPPSPWKLVDLHLGHPPELPLSLIHSSFLSHPPEVDEGAGGDGGWGSGDGRAARQLAPHPQERPTGAGQALRHGHSHSASISPRPAGAGQAAERHVRHGAGRCASSHAKRLDDRALEPMRATPPCPGLLGGVEDDGGARSLLVLVLMLGGGLRSDAVGDGESSRTPATRIWGRKGLIAGPRRQHVFSWQIGAPRRQNRMSKPLQGVN